jgi:two-component system response regulator RegX3
VSGPARSTAPPKRDGALLLIVEDEESFADAMVVGLEREGFRAVVASDGPEALQRFGELDPDVVLLDVMLPGLSGVDVCRQLRARSRVPIIMVSARDSEIDMVVGLEVGADDYVAKPFRLRELVARVRAVLRRSAGDDLVDGNASDGRGHAERSRSAAGVSVDIDRREASVDGRPLELPRKEFDLLAELVGSAGRVLTRDQLIERVWGYDYVGDTKTLDVHVKRLRSKLEPDPARPSRLLTVRGVGYKLVG